jgi:hypothetical protein
VERKQLSEDNDMAEENKGRKGDELIAHLTPGEIVIPRGMAEDEDFRRLLAVHFKRNDIDIEIFIAGSGKNRVNPETGYLEFGWIKKTWKKITRSVKKLFGGGDVKAPPLPPVPAPAPVPVTGSKTEDLAMQAARRRRGWSKTILTGALTPTSGKKTRLG